MAELLLNPTTEKALENYLNKPTHALLIMGVEGSGKLDMAKEIASKLLGLGSADSLDSQPFFVHLKRPEDKQSIPIEAVREALSATRLKNVHSHATASRVIIIENAGDLSQDAQNALLKDLEEPNPGTFFIITAATAGQVLPTIASRCQKIKLAPIPLDMAIKHFNYHSEAELRSAWSLSGGASALLAELLEKGEEHPLKQSVSSVKLFLGQTEYDRLVSIEEMSKNRQQTTEFAAALEKVLAALHKNALSQNNKQLAASLLKKRRNVQQLRIQLEANTNTRLVALELALEV